MEENSKLLFRREMTEDRPFESHDSLLFIDTCSLVHSAFPVWYRQRFLPVHEQTGLRLSIPKVVVSELARISTYTQPKSANAAHNAGFLLMWLPGQVEKNRIRIIGSANALEERRTNKRGELAFVADPIFHEKALCYVNMGQNVTVITNDGPLAGDLLEINSGCTASFRRFGRVRAAAIETDGTLSQWYQE